MWRPIAGGISRVLFLWRCYSTYSIGSCKLRKCVFNTEYYLSLPQVAIARPPTSPSSSPKGRLRSSAPPTRLPCRCSRRLSAGNWRPSWPSPASSSASRRSPCSWWGDWRGRRPRWPGHRAIGGTLRHCTTRITHFWTRRRRTKDIEWFVGHRGRGRDPESRPAKCWHFSQSVRIFNFVTPESLFWFSTGYQWCRLSRTRESRLTFYSECGSS